MRQSEKLLTKTSLLRCYSALIVLGVLLVVGCNAPIICQECINRVPDAPVFTHFTPLRSSPSTVAPIPEGEYKVARIIDGDTIVITDGTDEYRVRLIGIDAPEIRPLQPYGQESKHRVEELIESANGYVRLQFDGDGTDRSGRIRAHVYLTIGSDELWLNNLLVSEGLAISMLGFRYSEGAKRILIESEISARRHKRGMWSLLAPPFP